MAVRRDTEDQPVLLDGHRSAAAACYNCGEGRLFVFYDVPRVPVHSCLLVPTREEALDFPTGRLRLAFCRSCGFISNLLFDPDLLDYSESYEETQGFSPRFRAFARDLAARLVEKYDLRGRDVLEIGCGKGEFLALLCELGDNKGVGIDPAYVDGRLNSPAASRMTFIRDFYSEKYSHLSGDFIVCRHTLEHVQPTREFLLTLRRSLRARKDVTVFFEVPDVSRVLRDLAFWDIYYEHCSYFSLGSLARLFRSTGFQVLDLATDFDDQYLLIEARPAGGPTGTVFPREDDADTLAHDVEYFRENCARKLDAWRADLESFRERGQRPVIWGSGSKAVAYLTTLGVRDQIEYVVDINPFKHDMYLAGTGHRIVSPELLREYRPDVVIVMNPIYCDEIAEQLREMGVSAQLVPV